MEAEFPLPKSYPIRVHVNSKGDLYFLDGRERRIEIVSATGEESGPLSYKGLPSSTEVVPKSFTIDRNDNIYLLDILSRQVLVLDPGGQYSRQCPLPGANTVSSPISPSIAKETFSSWTVSRPSSIPRPETRIISPG